jgi:hypothetical protein
MFEKEERDIISGIDTGNETFINTLFGYGEGRRFNFYKQVISPVLGYELYEISAIEDGYEENKIFFIPLWNIKYISYKKESLLKDDENLTKYIISRL